MKLLHPQTPLDETGSHTVLTVSNDTDVLTSDLNGIHRIDLHFPKFSDGRAFSQAFELRHRRGFTGTIRATGDVLVDQLTQMQRCGFSEAVLRADQDPAVGERLLHHYPAYYQGDAAQPRSAFKRQTPEIRP